MQWFLNFPVWKKLILIFIAVGLTPMAVVGIKSINASNEIISGQVSNQLASVRTLKSNEITRYFQRIRNQAKTLSESPLIVDAALRLPKAYKLYRQQTGIDAQELERQKQHVKQYYRDQFGRQFQTINHQNADTNSMLAQLDDDSWALQYAYISNNPNILGEKHLLNSVNDSTTYSQIHEAIHPSLRSFLETFGFYDIFIADIETGDIIYSVFKELDYTTSLKNGPYSNTSIGIAFNKGLMLSKPDQTVLADFRTYLPSYNAPASFVASPIFHEGKAVGMLIFQMPIEDINSIMGERSGMGKTGESYLVGPDFLMRSDSYLDSENRNVVSSFKKPELGSVKTTAVESALKGESNTGIIKDYNGNLVLSSYSLLNLGDFQWAIISEQDVAEAFAAATSLKLTTLIVAAVCAIVVAAIAFWFSKLISNPINRVSDAIQFAEKNGSFENLVHYECNDEVGQMAAAFDRLLNSLSSMFNATNTTLKAVDEGNYQASIQDNYAGEMSSLCQGVNNTISQINKARQEQLKQQSLVEAASEEAQLKALEAEQSAIAA